MIDMNIDNEELADKLINQSLSIGRKPNPNIEKAKERYGEQIINKIKKDPTEVEKKIIKNLKNPEKGPVVYEEDGEIKIKQEVGHTVAITYHQHNRSLARAIERKCLKKGAHPILIPNNVNRTKEKYNLPPENTLRELPEITKTLAGEIDFSISIEPMEKTEWKKDIPKRKLTLNAPVKQKTSEIRHKNKVKWSYVGWPHRETAKDLGIDYEEFKTIMEESLKESFKPETRERIEKWHKTLKDTEEILIESKEGTKLKLDVKGRPFLKDDGVLTQKDIKKGDIGMNFPCGEIFTAPKEKGVEGKIFIPKTVVSSYGTVKDLWLHFEEGKVINYSAKKNEEHLDRFFKENTGEIKRIAELGIGCNKKAQYTEGYILIDEKILGTIHIAVGWNKGFGGKNKASSHHDFIKPMDQGKMYADGEIIMEKGKPKWNLQD